jgi:DNA ligase (NAD+)
LQPVQLAGTIVKRASLHNADQIAKLDIRVGDTVFVEKGGEIIPKIIGVSLEQRSHNSVPTKYIDTCPECQTPLVRTEGEAQHYCPNFYGCPPQIIGRIQHFITRKAMDIDGLGGGTLELLYINKKIVDYSDLYFLKYEDVLGLEKWLDNDDAGLKYNNQLQVKLEKAIYGLSKGWGNLTLEEAKEIAKNIKKIEEVFTISYDEIKVNLKKLNKFLDSFATAKRFINFDNYFCFEGYVSLNFLLEIKFSKYFENDLFLKLELERIDYIDNLLDIKQLKEDSLFESFVVSIADRNRVGIKEKSARILIDSIEKSKEIPFEKVLYSIGIKDVGEVGAKNIANHFKNIKNLMSASYEDLIEIRDVGNNTAKNIVDFFNNEKNVNLVEKLIDKGLIFSIQEKNNKSSKLENLTFVYSGTFSVSRDDLKKMIEENGGKVITALSKSISYLIVGDNMGPAKKEKALKDNIKMISEEEFYELLK